MQHIDERKRCEIVRVAARMFSSRPFHQVRLEDVASEAGIGKGTIYIYFQTKEHLYSSLLEESVADLLARLAETLGDERGSAWEDLATAVREIVSFSAQHPELFDMLRTGSIPTTRELEVKRLALVGLLKKIIRRGAREGSLRDAHPELTAQFILSSVRGAMLYRPPRTSTKAIAAHLLAVIGRGIRRAS